MEQTREFQEIIQALGSALIAATPENWDSATLELATDAHAEGHGLQGLSHSIHGPLGTVDVVFPSDEVFEATRRLELMFREANEMWKRATVRVWLDGESWRFASDFEY
jgi:hypothetical protein